MKALLLFSNDIIELNNSQIDNTVGKWVFIDR